MRVEVRAGLKFDRVLKAMAEAYSASSNKDALAAPYIITCAAALEAKLNDAIASYTNRLHSSAAGSVRLAYMSMSFRGKLEVLPLLLTDNKFRLNHSNEMILRLFCLISARNQLVHPKPSSHEVSSEKFEHPLYSSAEFFLPGKEYSLLVDDLLFGIKHIYKPEQYHEAIQKLDKWFFARLPDRVSKIALLVPNNAA